MVVKRSHQLLNSKTIVHITTAFQNVEKNISVDPYLPYLSFRLFITTGNSILHIHIMCFRVQALHQYSLVHIYCISMSTMFNRKKLNNLFDTFKT